MKTLTAVSYFVLLALSISCTDNKLTQPENPKEDAVHISVHTKADSSSSELSANKAVIGFLKWYSQNRNSLASISLINNASGNVFDSTNYYSINFKATEKYLSNLKESGFVSENYLNYWRQYFKQAEEQFKANPQNEGPPEGFEYDFVLLSQEIDDDLTNTNKAKVLSNSTQDTSATVVLQLASGQKLRYYLTNDRNSWLINKLEKVNE